ncbi:MAG: hypothetical protein RLY31_1286 [Bacteroidota bacterium]
MKTFTLFLFLSCTLTLQSQTNPAGENGQAQQRQTWSPKTMRFQIPAPAAPSLRYAVLLFGPDAERIEAIPEHTEYTFTITTDDLAGLGDGYFHLYFEPYYNVSASTMTSLRRLADNKAWDALRAARTEAGIPETAALYFFGFRMSGGLFVDPSSTEPSPTGRDRLIDPAAEPLDYTLTASADPSFGESAGTFSRLVWDAGAPALPALDQTINDDLIVIGSTCIGLDCATGEDFGFSTIRLKENNLRIEFDDTSSSSTFPNVDWELVANESSNGGKNLFAIRNRTGGKDILTTEADAPANSLYIAANGNVGLRTNMPAMNLHLKSGDTPTMRLEQDGSAGWSPQTWDVAGNETNFFIRNATNGSKLPFRIMQGAPNDAIIIRQDAVYINHELMVLGGLLDPSDERLKTNIQPLASVLPVLLQLVPQRYEFREDGLAAGLNLPDQRQYGLIAQQVEQILPEIVRDNLLVDQPEGEPVSLKSIQYHALIPLLLRGIQEQQEQLAAQQSELAELRETAARVTRLEQQLERLAALVSQLESASSKE